jgi:hypothetical protein
MCSTTEPRANELGSKPKDRSQRLQPDESRAFSAPNPAHYSLVPGSLVLQGKPEIIDPNAANQTHRSGLSGMLTGADWNGRVYQVRTLSPRCTGSDVASDRANPDVGRNPR